ncbi:unnamed protein product [Ectocarpus sp. 6 AP-2014]
MLRWAGFRRQGSDELFKIDDKRLGASDAVAAAVKEIWTKVAAAFPVVGYSQARTCCARFYEIYAYTQPATGDHSDRLADRAEYCFFVFCPAAFPIKTAVVLTRETNSQEPHIHSSVPEGQHTRTTPPEPGTLSRKPQYKALPPVPAGLCATESVKSNQGVCVCWGGRSGSSTRLCVRISLVSCFCLPRETRASERRDGFGIQLAVDRQRGEHEERVGPLHPGREAGADQAVQQSREHPLERIENGPVRGAVHGKRGS